MVNGVCVWKRRQLWYHDFWSRELLNRKSRDNNSQPVWLWLQRLIKFGSHLKPRVLSWPTHSVFSHLTHSTPQHLRHKASRIFIYESEGYSGYGIYLCFVYLSRYEVIILEYYPMTRSKLLIRQNQTSPFVKLSDFSLILVKVY